MKSVSDISIDHVAIPATNPVVSAKFLAELLALESFSDGPPDDQFLCVSFGKSQVMFVKEVAPFDPVHMALSISQQRFHETIVRLQSWTIPYGNSPDDPANRLTSDDHGGKTGRVYFYLPDGHLFEICY